MGLSCVSAVGISVNRGVCSVGIVVVVAEGDNVGAINCVGLGVGFIVSIILEDGFWLGDTEATPDGDIVGVGDRLGDTVPKTGTKILLHFWLSSGS